MIVVKATPASEAAQLPTVEQLNAMGKFNEELVKAGVLLAGEGLRPSSEGVRVRFAGEHRTVIDGPFTETKELISGFWILQVKSKEEAIEWAKRAPFSMFEGQSELEVRRVVEAEDFAPVMTPEMQAQEDRLRERVEQNAKR